MRSKEMLYREIQNYSRVWLWTVVVILAVIAWYAFFEQVVMASPIGDYPAPEGLLFILLGTVGIALPLCIRSLKLITEVCTDRIVVRFFPFVRKEFLFNEMDGFEVVRYNPKSRNCSHGLHFSPGRGWRFSVDGCYAVLIRLQNGRTVMIGSAAPDELFEHLSEAVSCPTEAE